MSITLHPGIGELEPDSLCHSIYTQLYNNFFNAQNAGTVVEGDGISIRLHNTAFGFAEAISSAVGGGDSESGVLIDYIKRSGGDMSGLLRANYGFEAGYNNTRLISTSENGVEIFGNLRVGGKSFYLGGRKVLSYDDIEGVCSFDIPKVSFNTSQILSQGDLLFGESKEKGVYISSSVIQVKGKDVYHSGNANLSTIDWLMRDGSINGSLNVDGTTTLSGGVNALQGFQFGFDGKPLLTASKETILALGFLSFASGYGIKIDDVPVLIRVNDSDIQLSSANGDLLLGSEQTNKIKLFAGVSDIDGDNILISKYGDGYFPASFKTRHNYGADLLSTYRKDDTDEGIIIHKHLRFGSDKGVSITGDINSLAINIAGQKLSITHRPSTSLYKPLDRESKTVFITTDSDFILYDKPIEGKNHIGIDGSYTRLTDGALHFTPTIYLQSTEGGIKHYGNATFTGNLNSERFASGFAGGLNSGFRRSENAVSS